LTGERVDEARLADIGAAGKGDLGQRVGGDRGFVGRAGNEPAGLGEEQPALLLGGRVGRRVDGVDVRHCQDSLSITSAKRGEGTSRSIAIAIEPFGANREERLAGAPPSRSDGKGEVLFATSRRQ